MTEQAPNPDSEPVSAEQPESAERVPAEPTGDEDPPVDPSRLTRRSFVLRSMTAVAAIAAAIVAIPTAAFMSAPGWLSTAPRRLLSHTVSPALRSDRWTSAGPIDRLRLGEPRHMIVERPIVDGWVQRDAPVGVYVLREGDDKATVLDPHCTHLGCPVEWSSGSGNFLCPCHGGSFDPEGYPVSGPPPRRMDVYETRVKDGEVQFRELTEPE